MNVNYDEDVIKELIINYQQAEGIPKERTYNKLYPYLNKVIDLHIYNIKEVYEREDARQNIHISLLKRLSKIKTEDIKSFKDYFYIMVKRLVLNEIDKIGVQTKRKLIRDNIAAELYSVFIIDEEGI